MNNYNISDPEFVNSELYQNFLNENPSVGYLKVRAYAAFGAVPISNLNVIVKKEINGNNVVFFEGATNSSGVIENISLPAPTSNTDDLVVPKSTTYVIEATNLQDNIKERFNINIYEGLYSIQTINIVPKMMRDNNGS